MHFSCRHQNPHHCSLKKKNGEPKLSIFQWDTVEIQEEGHSTHSHGYLGTGEIFADYFFDTFILSNILEVFSHRKYFLSDRMDCEFTTTLRTTKQIGFGRMAEKKLHSPTTVILIPNIKHTPTKTVSFLHSFLHSADDKLTLKPIR